MIAEHYLSAMTATPHPALPGSGSTGPDYCAEVIIHLARLAQNASDSPRLTPAQWTALRYFSRANRFSRTPSAFSEFHATTRGTASQTVKSLVALGLLERQKNSSDGRSTLMELTEAGREALEDDPLRGLIGVLQALPEAECNRLGTMLQHLATELARERTAPTFGKCVDCSHCEPGSSGAYCHCVETTLRAEEMSALCVDFRPRASV